MSGAQWVAVRGVGFFSPGFSDHAAWRSGVADPAVVGPRELIPAAARRRATWGARAAADVLAQALNGGPADGVALVYGSVGGELEQTFANLELLDARPPSSSPLRFGNSVHNAALGHLSIPVGNRRFGSALAAPPELLLPMVLLEAVLWARSHSEPVAVMWVEEVWPGCAFPPFAAAMVLDPVPAPGAPAVGAITTPRRGSAAGPGSSPLDTSPAAGVAAWLRHLGPAAATLGLGGGWEIDWRAGEVGGV